MFLKKKGSMLHNFWLMISLPCISFWDKFHDFSGQNVVIVGSTTSAFFKSPLSFKTNPISSPSRWTWCTWNVIKITILTRIWPNLYPDKVLYPKYDKNLYNQCTKEAKQWYIYIYLSLLSCFFRGSCRFWTIFFRWRFYVMTQENNILGNAKVIIIVFSVFLWS